MGCSCGCCRWGWGWALYLLALALALGLGGGSEEEEGPPEHFLLQETAECSFSPPPPPLNGSQAEGEPSRVRFIYRQIYDREEYVRFDSEWGEFRAITAFGEPDARAWNSQKGILDYYRSQVDTVCPHNYGIYAPFARARKIQPKLQITPIEHETSSGRTVLICDVDGFWPAEIEVKWFRNGKEEEGPQVMTTDLIRNGDWTFQIQVMLETKPQRGDLYACQVEHASFASPARVQWEPQSNSARSKMWTGIAGILLGLVFLAPGLLLYLKNRKGNVLPQSPAALMS